MRVRFNLPEGLTVEEAQALLDLYPTELHCSPITNYTKHVYQIIFNKDTTYYHDMASVLYLMGVKKCRSYSSFIDSSNRGDPVNNRLQALHKGVTNVYVV